MDVVLLHAEMQDPEIVAAGDGEGVPDGREDPAASKAAKRPHRAECDVRRMPGAVLGASGVWGPRPASRGELTARTVTTATLRGGLRKRKLKGAAHLA